MIKYTFDSTVKCESRTWQETPLGLRVFLCFYVYVRERGDVVGWHVVELMNIHAECPCGTIHSCN